MKTKEPILETDVLVSLPNLKDDAIYNLQCYDGYAIGTLLDEEYQCPNTIRMEYPTLDEVLKDLDLCHRILKYRGLWDKITDDIHYGDIMMFMGEIVDNN